MSETNRRCKYCGAKLKGEYLVKQGMCFYCDNEDCKVKPITDYNNASSDIFKAEVNEITMDKWDEEIKAKKKALREAKKEKKS